MSVIGDRRSREQKAKQEREKELAKVTIKKEDLELIRPSDSKSAGPVRKRKKIDLEQKMKIVKKYEGGQSLSSIARELDLAASTVKSILNDSARIKEHVKGSAPLKSTVITKQRSGAIYETEKLLTMWMEDQIQKCVPLSLKMIRAKAKSLFEDVKGKYSDPNAKFVASHGWFKRFKQRANFHNVKVSGEAANADTKAAEKYPEVLRELIEECGSTAQQIFNVRETRLFWKKMPDRTYISKEEKTMPGFKAAKDRLTLLLGANAAGDCKLKPLLVYHSENPHAFKGISKATLPVHFRSDRQAGVTRALFEDWFINLFIPEVEKFCRENGVPFKIMLIVDNAPGHSAHLDDFHPSVKVVFLPPSMTSILQPMDQGVIADFRARYLRRTFAQAVEATERETGETLWDFWNSYNIYQAIMNIAKAWAEVSPVCLNGVWKKACPQLVPSFHGFGKDQTYEEVTADIVNLAEQLELEVDVGDVDELIESHGAELSNEELMELEAAKVKEQTEAENEAGDVEEPRHFIIQEMARAFHEISSAMARFEKMDPNSSRFLEVNRGIDETLACYRQIYEKKRKATTQSSLNNFVKKVERPAKSTSPQPSTSKAPSDNPGDVMPVSSSPSSSTNKAHCHPPPKCSLQCARIIGLR